jgi:hypothetical protein
MIERHRAKGAIAAQAYRARGRRGFGVDRLVEGLKTFLTSVDGVALAETTPPQK